MPRLTKLEREALSEAADRLLAGDAAEFFNGGFAIHGEPATPDERRAERLARALATAALKL
jgi:hypothetical protein